MTGLVFQSFERHQSIQLKYTVYSPEGDRGEKWRFKRGKWHYHVFQVQGIKLILSATFNFTDHIQAAVFRGQVQSTNLYNASYRTGDGNVAVVDVFSIPGNQIPVKQFFKDMEKCIRKVK